MRLLLELQYAVRITQWAECADDGECELYAGYVGGRYVTAHSLALFISALQDATHAPLFLPLAA